MALILGPALARLGAPEVIESRGWFSNSNLQLRYLNKTWTVTPGRWLVTVSGTTGSAYVSGSAANGSVVRVNGTTIWEWDGGGTKGTNAYIGVGGYIILDGASSIVLTGLGQIPLREDPYVTLVKIG